MTDWDYGGMTTKPALNNPDYLRAMEAIVKTGKLPKDVRNISELVGLTRYEQDEILKALAKRQSASGGMPTLGLPPGLIPPGMESPGVGSPGGGGGGGGGAGGGAGGVQQNTVYQQMINKAEQEQKEAKQANEQRYQDLVAGYKERLGNAMKGLEGYGTSARADLSESYAGAASANQQQLVNSGLSGSTVATTTRTGDARREQEALNRLNESINQQKLGYQTQLSGDLLGLVERKEDTYPNMNLLAQLGNQLGQSGYWNAKATPSTGQANIQPAPVVGQSPLSATYGKPVAPVQSPSTTPIPVKKPIKKPAKKTGFVGRPGVAY